jgi:hypothetical protein
MSTTTGASVSSPQADLLAEALSKTGKFVATPVENGLAVRVETVARNAKDSAPVATSTVWLPDDEVGYAWCAPIDYDLPADAGLDRVVALVTATLLVEDES